MIRRSGPRSALLVVACIACAGIVAGCFNQEPPKAPAPKTAGDPGPPVTATAVDSARAPTPPRAVEPTIPDGRRSPLTIVAPTLGSSVVRVPATMKQGREVLAQLIVSPADLADLLHQTAVPGRDADVRDARGGVRLVPRMRASLLAPGFDYLPKDAQEQAVKPDEPTVWTWTLTPSESGPRTLVFTLEGLVTIDGRETALRPPALTVPVDVAIDPMRFVETYWQWGTTAIVIPLVVFLVRRRADRRASATGG